MKKFKIVDAVLRKRFKALEFLFVFRALLLRFRWWPYKLKLHFFLQRFLNFKSGRIRNVCIFTGRAGGVYKYFRASRFVLKGMDHVSVLPGIQRHTW